MFHGHQDTGGGPDFATGAFFFCTTVVSVFVAYYAMKFAAMQREQREAAEKHQRQVEVKKKGASA